MSIYSTRGLFARAAAPGGPKRNLAAVSQMHTVTNPHNWVHSIPGNITGGLKCTKCHKHWNPDEFEPKGNCTNNSVKAAIANIHKAAQK